MIPMGFCRLSIQPIRSSHVQGLLHVRGAAPESGGNMHAAAPESAGAPFDPFRGSMVGPKSCKDQRNFMETK